MLDFFHVNDLHNFIQVFSAPFTYVKDKFKLKAIITHLFEIVNHTFPFVQSMQSNPLCRIAGRKRTQTPSVKIQIQKKFLFFNYLHCGIFQSAV